jgi:SNF2 family DNA or RNA helicase
MNPYELWQSREVKEHALEERRALWADPRLGKTYAALASYARTRDKRGVRRLIVVAPLGVCPMWQRVAAEYEIRTVDLYSQIGRAKKEARIAEAFEDPDVALVCNYETAVNYEPGLLGARPEYLILDEAHYMMGVSSNRGRACRRLALGTRFVRELTGTPAPNHYGDLWGQLTALDPKVFGKYFTHFAREYLIMDSYGGYDRVIGFRNEEALRAKINRFVSIVRREDVFGPDTYQTIVRDLELPAEAQTLYKRLAKEWVLNDPTFGDIEAPQILKRLIRLQQLSSGYLVNEEHERIDVHRAKIDAVLADLDDIRTAKEKAVIFHRFIWEGQRYVEELTKAGHTVVGISGKTPVHERAEIMERFRKCQKSMVVVIQPKAAGIGTSFATATHALFVSESFSWAEDKQAMDRIYEPGAVRVVTRYRAKGTIDNFIGRVLGTKGSIAAAVRNADREELIYGLIRRSAVA